MPRPKTGVDKNCVICDRAFYIRPSEEKKYSCCSTECGKIRRSRLKTRLSHGLSDTPEMRRFWVRRCKLKQKYNLTIEQWEQKFEAQGRRCAACESTDPKGKTGWHTDHDHKTGVLRGILCSKCNLALGHAEDSIKILQGLTKYLEAYSV